MDGKEFMQKYDFCLFLVLCDIVVCVIDNEMKNCGDDYVYFDVIYKDLEEIKKYFFNIYEKCLSLGIDIIREYIFVVLLVYYFCGGIKVDLNG